MESKKESELSQIFVEDESGTEKGIYSVHDRLQIKKRGRGKYSGQTLQTFESETLKEIRVPGLMRNLMPEVPTYSEPFRKLLQSKMVPFVDCDEPELLRRLALQNFSDILSNEHYNEEEYGLKKLTGEKVVSAHPAGNSLNDGKTVINEGTEQKHLQSEEKSKPLYDFLRTHNSLEKFNHTNFKQSYLLEQRLDSEEVTFYDALNDQLLLMLVPHQSKYLVDVNNWKNEWHTLPSYKDWEKEFKGSSSILKSQFFDLDPNQFGKISQKKQVIDPRTQGLVKIDSWMIDSVNIYQELVIYHQDCTLGLRANLDEFSDFFSIDKVVQYEREMTPEEVEQENSTPQDKPKDAKDKGKKPQAAVKKDKKAQDGQPLPKKLITEIEKDIVANPKGGSQFFWSDLFTSTTISVEQERTFCQTSFDEIAQTKTAEISAKRQKMLSELKETLAKSKKYWPTETGNEFSQMNLEGENLGFKPIWSKEEYQLLKQTILNEFQDIQLSKPVETIYGVQTGSYKNASVCTISLESGLVVKSLSNGDVLIKNFDKDLLVQERYRLITPGASVIKFMPENRRIIYMANGNISEFDGVDSWTTTNNKGLRKRINLRTGVDEELERIPCVLKNNAALAQHPIVYVREDDTKMIMYEDGERLVIFPDGTKIFQRPYNSEYEIEYPRMPIIRIFKEDSSHHYNHRSIKGVVKSNVRKSRQTSCKMFKYVQEKAAGGRFI